MPIINPLTGKAQKVIIKPVKAHTHEDLAAAKEKAKAKTKPKADKKKKNAKANKK